ncbi:MAG: BREX system ATP-binding domain-containing protein [Candidatus Dormibacteria bacterium]
MSQDMLAADYSAFLQREYLAGFIADGGSAVKVAAASSRDAATQLSDAVVRSARAAAYEAVVIDSATTRVSLIQQVFFALASSIHWGIIAREIVSNGLTKRLGITVAGHPTLEAISTTTGHDPSMLRGEILKGLRDDVYRNYALAKDFRLAMLEYCMAELDADARADQTRELIKDWLTGDLRLISALRELAIFQRIGRHNARVMVASTAEWLRHAGHPGLVILLDMQQLAVSTRREVVNGALFYTPANVMDAYEVLRQFIDATDEMSGLLLLIIASTALLEDERRGFQAYPALQNRIWDDVRDRDRVNPFAPLVRVTEGDVP